MRPRTLALRLLRRWTRDLRALRARHGRRTGELLWGLRTLVVVGLTYGLVNRFNAWRGVQTWSPATDWDRALPAVPWLWPVYAANLPLYLLWPLFGPARPALDLQRARTLLGLMVVQVASLACFLLWPCRVDLRDQLPAASTHLAGWLQGLLHGLDRPWNAWPSLHVSHTLVMALWAREALLRPPRGTRPGVGRGQGPAPEPVPHAGTGPVDPGPGRRWLALLPLLLWSAIAASIVLVKQHYLFDLLTGSALGAGVALALRPGWRRAHDAPGTARVG